MLRVSIIAASPALRAGLQFMLNSPEIQVVGEAVTLAQLPADLEDQDVLVLAQDNLPEDFGTLLDERNQKLALVVLSDDDGLTRRLNRLPVRSWGLLSPLASTSELQAAVLAVAQGLTVLPRAAMDVLLGQRQPLEVLDSLALEEPLTQREQEVLELLSQGLSNKLMARRLQISEHTVKFHVSSLYTKLAASSRAEAVSRGARLGLITF